MSNPFDFSIFSAILFEIFLQSGFLVSSSPSDDTSVTLSSDGNCGRLLMVLPTGAGSMVVVALHVICLAVSPAGLGGEDDRGGAVWPDDGEAWSGGVRRWGSSTAVVTQIDFLICFDSSVGFWLWTQVTVVLLLRLFRSVCFGDLLRRRGGGWCSDLLFCWVGLCGGSSVGPVVAAVGPGSFWS